MEPNALTQYDDSKRAHDYDAYEPPDCELLPIGVLAAWQAIDHTTPILAGDQYPPMASFLAAPSMHEAVIHCLRVSNALAALRK